MNAAELMELLERDPFQPLRVRLSSGDTFEIRNPHLAVPMKSRLLIADAGTDQYSLIPYLHIAAVDVLHNGNGRHGRSRRKRR